jgi:hypothetical protein
MPDQRGLTIHFTDGTRMSLDFPQQTQNEAASLLKLEDVLKIATCCSRRRARCSSCLSRT